MTEEKNTPSEQPEQAQPSQPEPVEPEVAAAPPPTSAEVEEGKTFAILSYALSLIGLPFFLVPLIMRNNEFSLYHAKQCLLIWLIAVVGGTVLSVTCVGPLIITIFAWVLLFIGISNSVKNLQVPVPLVGKWAEDWFKGIKKV